MCCGLSVRPSLLVTRYRALSARRTPTRSEEAVRRWRTQCETISSPLDRSTECGVGPLAPARTATGHGRVDVSTARASGVGCGAWCTQTRPQQSNLYHGGGITMHMQCTAVATHESRHRSHSQHVGHVTRLTDSLLTPAQPTHGTKSSFGGCPPGCARHHVNVGQHTVDPRNCVY